MAQKRKHSANAMERLPLGDDDAIGQTPPPAAPVAPPAKAPRPAAVAAPPEPPRARDVKPAPEHGDAFDDGIPFDLPPAPADQIAQSFASGGEFDDPFDDVPLDDAPLPPVAAAHPDDLYGEPDPFPVFPARNPAAHAPPPPPGRKLSISQRALGAAHAPAAAYLDGLNPEQRLAVETLDGPVLVLAGAGTGKTKVLTSRIAHILSLGRAQPWQILAVTFTNKAAREMKHRITAIVGPAAEGMSWLGTFHAIGVKILRRHHELVGLKSGFTILDTDDQLRLMKQVIEAEGIDKDRWPARQLANLIDSWKNRALTPDKVPAGESFSFAGGKGQKLYAAYQRRLKELNACDFGDLLVENIRLFRENPDILADYQRRFRYILVDEYQDTNVAQYLWLRLLAQAPVGEQTADRQAPVANICCVGDDDQSIYGWRGAEVENILRFDKDFPGAKVIRLERNYRSTGHILAAAATLIAQNAGRLGKTLFTDDALGEKVTVTGVWDDEEEARTICDVIERERREGANLNEIAILVRASFQMRSLEDRLVTTGIPYRVIGGPKFYERQEIKDAIAYLEVTLNPANDLKFERIVNTPKRGLGDTTIKRLHDLASTRAVPMYTAAREMAASEELTGKARRALTGLLASFERWRGQVDTMRHTELAELILDESGYTAMWQADKSPQAQSRLENLKELVRFMHDFENLGGFLEHVSLVMDADQNDDGERVSLMTLHAAKGLEFDTVFLPGFEEGLFPHQRSLDESGAEGLEEERRLAYVGLTRAKKRAKVSFAQNRRNRGLYQSAIPSRFVDELPEENVDVIESKSPFSGPYKNFGSGFGLANPFGASRFDKEPGRTSTGGFTRYERDEDSQDNERPGGGSQSNWGGAGRSTYDTPGWQRAKARAAQGEGGGRGQDQAFSRPVDRDAARKAARSAASRKRGPLTIDGTLTAASTVTSAFKAGERVFHDKFGYGTIASVEGNKLIIDFEKAGQKHVVDSFVERI